VFDFDEGAMGKNKDFLAEVRLKVTDIRSHIAAKASREARGPHFDQNFARKQNLNVFVVEMDKVKQNGGLKAFIDAKMQILQEKAEAARLGTHIGLLFFPQTSYQFHLKIFTCRKRGIGQSVVPRARFGVRREKRKALRQNHLARPQRSL
jgi:hypothetical protein